MFLRQPFVAFKPYRFVKHRPHLCVGERLLVADRRVDKFLPVHAYSIRNLSYVWFKETPEAFSFGVVDKLLAYYFKSVFQQKLYGHLYVIPKREDRLPVSL